MSTAYQQAAPPDLGTVDSVMNRQTPPLRAVRPGHRSEFVQTLGGLAIPGLQRGTDNLYTGSSTVIGDGVDSRENAPSDRPTAAPARPVRYTPDACTAQPARAQLMINRLNSPPAVGDRQVRTVFPQGLPRILGAMWTARPPAQGLFHTTGVPAHRSKNDLNARSPAKSGLRRSGYSLSTGSSPAFGDRWGSCSGFVHSSQPRKTGAWQGPATDQNLYERLKGPLIMGFVDLSTAWAQYRPRELGTIPNRPYPLTYPVGH